MREYFSNSIRCSYMWKSGCPHTLYKHQKVHTLHYECTIRIRPGQEIRINQNQTISKDQNKDHSSLNSLSTYAMRLISLALAWFNLALVWLYLPLENGKWLFESWWTAPLLNYVMFWLMIQMQSYRKSPFCPNLML